jgi:hypothetical protein
MMSLFPEQSRNGWLLLICLGMMAWLLPLTAAAQETVRQSAPHHFLIQERATGRVVQRGISARGGVAFDRLILSPDTAYRIWILQASTLLTGYIDVNSPAVGGSLRLPSIRVGTDLSSDGDGDALSDDAEFIMGTDPAKRDTDGDGILDGAEVRQGTDPLSGRAVRTGIIATAETPGTAVDICAINDLAVVADRDLGIAVFNVFNGMNPVLISQVDTPGKAVAVACAGNLIAVADETAGLAVVDITDPPAARILHQVNLGATATSVATAGRIAFVGLSNGQLASVDLPSGTILDRVALGTGGVQDVATGGDMLYALVVGRLHVLPLEEGRLRIGASIDSPGNLGAGRRRLRLFIGDRLAYATHTSGYNIIDVSTPLQPRLVRGINTAQAGWKQIAASGSGQGLAAVSPNSTDDGPHHISLYNLDPGGTNSQFVTTFDTPGLAAAVAIYNGIAYVADSQAGLQVINYLTFDALGRPPSITLETSFPAGSAEEGKTMRVTAHVSDDVQVRNVEFHLDGAKLVTDGNFPFEHLFVTPLRSAQRDSFTLRAKAADTGGNATWSGEIRFQLVPDATPPRVVRVQPGTGAIIGGTGSITAFFSEPVIPSTVHSGSFLLIGAGADGLIGTPDDVNSAASDISYRESLNAAILDPGRTLDPGLYQIVVRAPLADVAGNAIDPEFRSTFRVFSRADRDQDGIPDELEATLGLDPDNSDTNGNGIPDGQEDPDRDGIVNAGEFLIGTDPLKADTNGNGVLDGLEDRDNDALVDGREVQFGTDPLIADSDGDGWNDEAEVSGRSDPLNPASRPRMSLIARPVVGIAVTGLTPDAPLRAGVTIARPSVAVGLTSMSTTGELRTGLTLARPIVTAGLPTLRTSDGLGPSVTIGRPVVQVGLTSFNLGENQPRSLTIGQPPVRVGPAAQ